MHISQYCFCVIFHFIYFSNACVVFPLRVRRCCTLPLAETKLMCFCVNDSEDAVPQKKIHECFQTNILWWKYVCMNYMHAWIMTSDSDWLSRRSKQCSGSISGLYMRTNFGTKSKQTKIEMQVKKKKTKKQITNISKSFLKILWDLLRNIRKKIGNG